MEHRDELRNLADNLIDRPSAVWLELAKQVEIHRTTPSHEQMVHLSKGAMERELGLGKIGKVVVVFKYINIWGLMYCMFIETM